jgi:hypothetical protein
VSWIPVDILATIITELISKDCLLDIEDNEGAWTRYYYLTNSHHVKWATLIPTIQNYFAKEPLNVVGLEEWVIELAASGKMRDADAAENPGLKLLHMFQGLGGLQGNLILETEHTRERSTAMQGLQPMNQNWMRLWLEQWAF